MTEERTPSDTHTHPEEPAARAADPPSILLVGQYGATVRELPQRATLSVGRSANCDLQLDHSSVSRLHATLEVDGTRFRVCDTGSVNGVRVRGRRLQTGEVVSFSLGEVVELGRAMMVVIAQRSAELGDVTSPSARPVDIGGAVVQHPSMLALYGLVERVAASNINVLVLGETGVGKELLVEALHRCSPRAGRPFVRLNCAALSPTVVESELFGHEKGAFTGALTARPGWLEAAHGGTLFLDEVGELPAALQPKILRVIEDRQVWRVGAQRPREVDVRFVAATLRDLRAEVAVGNFRRDLYYRLNGITLAIPPLRERRSEIRQLAEHFLRQANPPRPSSALSPEVVQALESYVWPGNVRELRNVIARALLFADTGPITLSALPEEITAGAPPAASTTSTSPGLRGEIDAIERRRIEDALAQTGGNQTRAAILLGMPRRTLVTRLQQYGLTRARRDGPGGSEPHGAGH